MSEYGDYTVVLINGGMEVSCTCGKVHLWEFTHDHPPMMHAVCEVGHTVYLNAPSVACAIIPENR